MSAGTLKLTNGSTAVTGTGTSFTTDLTTADFVFVTVGGTTHSLAVDSVTNATALVLSAPFTGPTTASVAWQAVPRKAMLRVTAELNRQVTEALRLGNENAINWQAVLSADDTATVVLPDGTTLTGLSWKKLSEIMTDMDIDAIKPLAAQIHTDAAQVAADKPVIVQAKTDAIAAKNAAAGSQTAAAGSATAAATSATTATQQADRAQSANPDNQLKKANNLSDLPNVGLAKTNIQVDRLVQVSTETMLQSPGKQQYYSIKDTGQGWGVYDVTSLAWIPLGVARGGTGALTPAAARTNLKVLYQEDASLQASDNLNDYNSTKSGEFRCASSVNATPANNYPIQEAGSLKVYLTLTGNSATSCIQEYRTYLTNRLFTRRYVGQSDSWSAWAEFYSTANTTVDSNGFIKKASPIIKVFGDGKCETNDESEGVTVNRVSEGVYHITECLGLNSDLAWGGVAGGIEVPKDINGQPQIWVDYDVESDGSITLKTYHREHANAPEFARNIVDGYSDGSPRDIPVGVFVSLRVEMSSDSKYNIAIRKAEIAMKVKNYIDNNNAELAAMPMMLK